MMHSVKPVFSFLIAGALSLSLLGAAMAGPRDSFLNHEQDKNHFQIHEGVENGDLNHHEAKQLLKDQHKIEAYEDKARENGKISKKELRRLDKMQAEQRRAIEEKTITRP